jgi:hypothetical protein
MRAWIHTVKARALCPYTDESAVGMAGYLSPEWYRTRGAAYFVNLATPLSPTDVQELNLIGRFINRSFVISMCAALEAYNIVPFRENPDRSRIGGDHVQLAKWLRNRFAHGAWEYDPRNGRHVETRDLLRRLFPAESAKDPGFAISIDGILEPLKDGVLGYIRATHAHPSAE